MPNCFLIIAVLLAANTAAFAEDPPQLPEGVDPSNLTFTIPPSLVTPFIKAIALGADHRPYEPATALGKLPGVTLGIELTLAKPGVNRENGGALGQLPVLPVPRLNIHKGLGPIDIGLSVIYYKGYKDIRPMKIYGGDIKIPFYAPEEGLTMAARLNYTISHLWIVSTTTITPQILVSRQMDFADPYLGIGFQYGTGKVSLPITALGRTLTLEGQGKAKGGLAFTGVQFKGLGLMLTLEGSYSTAGVHALGTKIGLAF